MPKRKPTSKNNTNSKIAIISGAVIIILTPLVQPIVIYFLTRNCPMLGEVTECGLTVGYRNAYFAETIPAVWLVLGLTILWAGLVMRSLAKK